MVDISEDEDDEIIWVSKSEIKRDAEETEAYLGAELGGQPGKNALDKIPLDADSRAADRAAPSVSRWRVAAASCSLSVRCCASRDVDPIRQALDKLKNRHNQQVALFHKLEQIRDRLIDDGDDAVAEVLEPVARG